jgi:deoxyribose-phosphate aldolase
MLDERLFGPRLSLAEFVAGCRTAADSKVAAVVCNPSRVALAAHLLAGRGVKVAALASHESLPGPPVDIAHLLANTERLLQDGANEIGVLAPRGPLRGSARTAFAKAIRTVANLAETHHATVKVLLPATGLTTEQLVTACKLSTDSGATMVQGGTPSAQDRVSFSQIALMRQALGDEVQLKWSTPMASLDRLLLARAEGVDRFNADTTAVLKEAAERNRFSKIRIPEPGQDY